MSSLFLELSKQQRLLHLMEERGFTLCQQNGQRCYGGPPPNWGSRPIPSRECEVFIGRIPRMCFEDELIPLFLTVGELYEFRLMLDFSGTNRGYGYAHYATREGAASAIKILNKYEIRPGHQIGVLKSKNNCRLLFGNIRPNITFQMFNDFIRAATHQVLNVFMFTGFDQLKAADLSITVEVEEAFLERMPRNCPNSQYAIVEFENHKAAAVARRILIPKFGHVLAVDWALPPRERKNPVPANGISSAPMRAFHPPNGASNFVPVHHSTRAKPVPVLMSVPSIFDGMPYMPKTFRNVVKYFKFLICTTLSESVKKNEISQNVLFEIERKIVERITNLENCGHAVQLILNYLAWYNEKKAFAAESDTHKILEEVKIYSNSFVHFIHNKLSYRKTTSSALDNYYCNVLPVQLNIIFHLALILTGEDRRRLSGRITTSLQWFHEAMEKIKAGDASARNLLAIISRIELEPNDINAGKNDFINPKPFWFKDQAAPSNVASPYADGSYPTNGYFTYHNLSSMINICTGNGSTSESSPIHQRSIVDKILEIPVESHPNRNSDALRSTAVHSGEFPFNQYNPSNSILIDNARYIPPSCAGNIAEAVQEDSARGVFEEPRLLGNPTGDAGGSGRSEQYSEIEKLIDKCRSVPVLISDQSITDTVTFMPKSLQNVVRYFKYLISLNLHRYAENMAVPCHLHKELERKVVQNIINLEGCCKAADIILGCLSWYNGETSKVVDAEIEKVLQDVKLYASSFISYIHNRAHYGLLVNQDSENYYCRILPLQLSFIFHLAIVSTGDEKMQLSGRISSSLQWLNDFIDKSKSGEINLTEYFERIARCNLENGSRSHDKNAEHFVKATLREASKEFYMLIESPRVDATDFKM